jgi:hypothetical protein
LASTEVPQIPDTSASHRRRTPLRTFN